MKKLSLLIVFALIWSGCTSMQTLLTSPSVSDERLLLKTKPTEKNSAELVVFRDQSISGSACYYAIYIDNMLAARIGTAEKVVFNVEPGDRMLKVTRDPQGDFLCSDGDDMTEQRVSLTNSDKKYFRLSTRISGWPDLQVMQPPASKF